MGMRGVGGEEDSTQVKEPLCTNPMCKNSLEKDVEDVNNNNNKIIIILILRHN